MLMACELGLLALAATTQCLLTAQGAAPETQAEWEGINI
jgi:hypothetical protein